MKNQNLAIIKKAGEERYFKTMQEFIQWYERQAQFDEWDNMLNAVERLRQSMQKGMDYFRGYFPEKDGDTFKVFGDGHFRQYVFHTGPFQRTSGTYQINVLAIQ